MLLIADDLKKNSLISTSKYQSSMCSGYLGHLLNREPDVLGVQGQAIVTVSIPQRCFQRWMSSVNLKF